MAAVRSEGPRPSEVGQAGGGSGRAHGTGLPVAGERGDGPGPAPDPSSAGPGAVLRAELVERLGQRFERRLVVVEAGAGFGKSTLLAQALEEGRAEPGRVDVALRLDERDRAPEVLLARLADALDIDGDAPSVDDLVEAVWARAPEEVAVVLDDVHHLDGAPGAWAVVADLLARLPDNGHLVVSGRRPPELPVARWQAADQVLVVDEGDLAFDEHDLAALAQAMDLPPAVVAELPTWPALATLTGLVGRQASMAYLWEQVLATLDDDRRRLLAAVAPFGVADDDLVAALGGDRSAEQLVVDLPLVDHPAPGVVRLHDLWREALAPVLTPGERRGVVAQGGRHLLGRGDLQRAATAAAVAEDRALARAVALAFAQRPTLRSNVPELDALLAGLGPLLGGDPAARYLEAARAAAVDDRRAVGLFRRAAEAAAAAGDDELEVLARWRVVQFEDLELIGGPPPTPRLAELAARGAPQAGAVLAFLDSRRAQLVGDVDAAVAALDGLDGFAEDQRAVSLGIRLNDLGRPEGIPATLASVLADGLADLNHARAVWVQGMVEPRHAWPLARDLVDRAEDLPLLSRVSLLAFLATMAVAAGELDEAQALAAEALRLAASSARTVALFADVADALVALAVAGEDAASARLGALVAEVPLGSWPERPYLSALCALRALVPGGERLDDLPLGPSLRVAVEAGAAVAALRAGDAGPATVLPWHRAALLAVHVPGPLLAELALAASEVGGAVGLLEDLPHRRAWALRLVDRPDPVGARARALVASLPARPGYDLRVEVLGGLRLVRSDGVSTSGWDRRERVRQLLAALVLDRSVSRPELAERLWPDLPPERAAANLRVNLHHLQRALQPERQGDDPPWFVRAEADRLVLVADGVVVDRDELDRSMAEAVRAEARGLGSRALAAYRRVVDLHRGDLLPGVRDERVDAERLRLRSLAHAAATRAGELELARGEPEVALGLATRSAQLDPLSERSARLALRGHLALGSVGAARQVAVELLGRLADAGITPDPETRRLLGRLLPEHGR